MKRFFSSRGFAAALLGLGGLAAASAAQARSEVYLSIGVPAAPVYVHPAPVYGHPQPVYVQPRPVYVQPQPIYVQPRPVYRQQRGYHGPHYVAPVQHGWNGHPRRGPNGDLDRDGVRNFRDRDRDGDGVRNRHDSRPNNPRFY